MPYNRSAPPWRRTMPAELPQDRLDAFTLDEEPVAQVDNGFDLRPRAAVADGEAAPDAIQLLPRHPPARTNERSLMARDMRSWCAGVDRPAECDGYRIGHLHGRRRSTHRRVGDLRSVSEISASNRRRQGAALTTPAAGCPALMTAPFACEIITDGIDTPGAVPLRVKATSSAATALPSPTTM